MSHPSIDDILAQTLEDHRLSRGERKAFRAVLDDLNPNHRLLADIRTRAFAAARAELSDSRDTSVLEWLEEVVRVIESEMRGSFKQRLCEAVFSPGEDCPHRIAGLLGGTRREVDICVFTITDDRIADPVIEAHRRGVKVRIITDDEKVDDRGSDILRLRGAGIAVATDHSEFQMHHKFAIFDDRTVLTGSYNWTRSAAEHNQENFVVSDDPRLVEPYRREFERLWKKFRGP